MLKSIELEFECSCISWQSCVTVRHLVANLYIRINFCFFSLLQKFLMSLSFLHHALKWLHPMPCSSKVRELFHRKPWTEIRTRLAKTQKFIFELTCSRISSVTSSIISSESDVFYVLSHDQPCQKLLDYCSHPIECVHHFIELL